MKRTGDGSLIEFRSVVDAVRCAIDIQNGMVERNAGLRPERRIEFRVGIHLGDVVEESDGNLMGDGVNIAARLDWSENPERSIQTSLEIAQRAVEIDDEDPSAHVWFAIALFWHREHDRAFAEAQRGISLSPNLAEGHLATARILTYSGDGAAAIDTLNTYMRLDPLYPDLTLHFLAEAQVSPGQFDAAVATLKQRLERNPN